MWVRIEAPYFVAGVELDEEGFVTLTAPILRWMRGKKFADQTAYLDRKGWSYVLYLTN